MKTADQKRLSQVLSQMSNKSVSLRKQEEIYQYLDGQKKDFCGNKIISLRKELNDLECERQELLGFEL